MVLDVGKMSSKPTKKNSSGERFDSFTYGFCLPFFSHICYQPPFNSSHIMKTLQDPEPGQLPYTYPMTNYEVYRLRGKSPWRKGGPRKCGFIHDSRALFSELLRLL